MKNSLEILNSNYKSEEVVLYIHCMKETILIKIYIGYIITLY